MSEQAIVPGRSLAWVFNVVRRLPVVGVVAAGLLVIVLVAVEAEPWRLTLAGVAVAIGLGMTVVVRRLTSRPRLASVPLTILFATAIFAVQTLVIVASGGIESPLAVGYIPASILIAVTAGRRVAWLASIVLPLLALVALTLVEVLAPGDSLTLGVIDRTLPGSHAAGVIAFAGFVAATVVFGGLLGTVIRDRLDRAWATTTSSQAALAETLGERNAELVGLAGAIAHELKNPLAAISGLSVLLARKAEPGSREAEQLEVLVGEAKRMGRVLEEFLNFSRPLSDIAVADTALAPLLRDVVAIHEGLAERAGVKVRLDLAPDAVVPCDPRKVRQVVTNLLQNALEVSPSGGVITVTLRTAAAGAEILVDDAGPGLDPSVGDQAFRPGVTTKGGGSGLGLTVARSIAEQHGGTVRLDDRPEGGCRAALTLPAAC
ncbi:MAG: HAMP domain-containing histidine kinase [Deltaproteobacteria bacterium]|nr:MAG: HAMP domain-containing histidine kinase [Deltaproteobacteria bacterium]